MNNEQSVLLILLVTQMIRYRIERVVAAAIERINVIQKFKKNSGSIFESLATNRKREQTLN
jgi:hypothetical protein